MYVICDEVVEYYRQIKAVGAEPGSELGDRMYGMRDFVVLVPDGNQQSFGCDNERGDEVAELVSKVLSQTLRFQCSIRDPGFDPTPVCYPATPNFFRGLSFPKG